MKDVKVIKIHPGMANIKCIVKPSIKVNEISLLLTRELSKLHTEVPKTIIFATSFVVYQLTNIIEKGFKAGHNKDACIFYSGYCFLLLLLICNRKYGLSWDSSEEICMQQAKMAMHKIETFS